ncbi:ImmA/IrrE family metallo-endopeptidase [Rhizobium laguerreae]|uniref:M48 family metalloprotease n=1 Tax=Rhizobium laguerreae TaxID=1076926 RepID=UPI001C904EC4|nr:M48 family metalloprotease [Rhizobium laguerreae]MBY3143293.1 ImmA/IrrE family metallo-endopeptidase [Rhizobium laguerreae]MBY3574313.1 ImmA/IrrE family metallo-endopeptidase [Rhizobium laguerreae]
MDNELTLLSRWQRENKIRARSVSVLAFSIATLYFGTEMYQPLRGTWFEGISNGHLLFAALVYWMVFALVFRADAAWSLIKLRRIAPRRLYSQGVRKHVTNCGLRFGIKPIALGFGSPHEKRILCYWVGKKPVVLIGPWSLSVWATAPEQFEFSLAHELAHLTARDDKSDRIVNCHHICFGIFMAAVLSISLYGYIANAIEWNRLTAASKVVYSRHNTALFAFFDSFILLALFLFATLFLTFERVATRHGREIAADGVAAQVTGKALPRSKQPTRKKRWWDRAVRALLRRHPDQSQRRRAVQAGNPFVSANRILFVSQAFLASYFIDLSLQVLSFDARHRASIAAWGWRDRPLSIFAPFLIAALFYYNSSRLMVNAASLSAYPGKRKASLLHFKDYLAYTLTGAVLMAVSSQSVWYIVRGSGLGGLWPAQWDMLSIVLISSLALAFTLSTATTVAGKLPSVALRILPLMPLLVVCTAAVSVMINMPPPPRPCTMEDINWRTDC